MLLPNSFTYVSQAHGSTSWLDHCITTVSSQSIISNCYIINDIVCSDHLPLCIDINCDITPICDTVINHEFREMPKWHLAKDKDTLAFNTCTNKLFDNINVPKAALSCKVANCVSHHGDIDCFYNSIISVLKLSTSTCIPSYVKKNASTFHPIAGWNEYVKEHHQIARDAFMLWNLYNRPTHGYIYHTMRISRARFK